MAKNKSFDTMDHVINELLSQRVDGIIVNISCDSNQISQIQKLCQNIAVLIMDVDPTEPCFSVMTDSREGGRQGIGHLIELGHTLIALVTGPCTSVSARLRYEGRVKELQTHDLSPVEVLEGYWGSASGYVTGKGFVVL